METDNEDLQWLSSHIYEDIIIWSSDDKQVIPKKSNFLV